MTRTAINPWPWSVGFGMDAFLAAGLGGEARPLSAFTLIGVSRLAYPELMVELEAIACA